MNQAYQKHHLYHCYQGDQVDHGDQCHPVDQQDQEDQPYQNHQFYRQDLEDQTYQDNLDDPLVQLNLDHPSFLLLLEYLVDQENHEHLRYQVDPEYRWDLVRLAVLFCLVVLVGHLYRLGLEDRVVQLVQQILVLP